MSKQKNHWEETLEKFEKFLKGEELNVNIYDIGYCPVCDGARIVYYYSPDDDYCSIQNRRNRMRFEPCGHDTDQKKWEPIINWPSKARAQYLIMQTPAYQLKIFSEKLKEWRRSQIEQHEKTVQELNDYFKRVAKIKRSLKK